MAESPLDELDRRDREQAAEIEEGLFPLLHSVADRGSTIRDPTARQILDRCQKHISKMLHGKMIGIVID